MSLNPFKKQEDRKNKKSAKKENAVVAEETKETSSRLPITGNAEAYRILKNFYISEKASLLNGFNQYVFKVFRNSNKSQIKDQVEKLFNVKVKDVKVLNMPRKRRDLGRHPGFKSEFKKSIVVLEKGQTIEQAKL